ncbi:MAG: pyridoxamine 5'-phosphate oxidase [Bacteroidota bacterium]|jgi:pyridoxamine 5'-phosphate oxidase
MKDFLDLLRNDHHQFDQGKLEDHLGKEPFETISNWLSEAIERKVHEPNAIALSTFGLDGYPQTRIVYLRELLQDGLVFYTNYNSDKGRSIAANPNVHVLIFWPEMERQISISGKAEKVPDEMSDAYFSSRPWGSKIGAWASHQSEKLSSRQELEDRVHEYAEQFTDDVPRPPHWGGYLVRPEKVEFWQGRRSRLHDRVMYEFSDGNWQIYRKNP